MNQQPEALRLADALSGTPDCNCAAWSANECACDAVWPEQFVAEAAAELRRLHNLVFELQEKLKNRDETSTYNVWRGMVDRCNNRSNGRFKRYGGRGIKVCDRWLDYANFLADMGVRPPGKSLDRIDNDGDYEPSNCRWATQAEQQRNTSRTRMFTHAGKTMCLNDWAKELGIHKNTLRSRIDDRGMTFEQAIHKPIQARRIDTAMKGQS